ncbi:MAG: 1,4-dihydroxy-6-naphthoate synthase [Bacteroidota bacterium]
MSVSLGFSPCPNDTFIFDALVNNRLSNNVFSFSSHIEDVEQLNRRAFADELDITKLSFNAFAKVSAHYQLLTSGAALGKNCGPLVVMKKNLLWSDLPDLKIAIPGMNTTANLLLTLFAPNAVNKKEMLFSDIEAAVLDGTVDAGLIIHESRFTYEAKGLKKMADMGELWEQYTGCPLPLGCIAVKRNLPEQTKSEINRLVRESVQYAYDHPGEADDFIKQHASEMSEEVQQRHINLYVNEFSIDLGEQGKKAIELLFRKGREMNLLPEITQPLFVA